MLNKHKFWILTLVGALLWFALHIPSIKYGTDDVPLYITYVGDEQVPVNGALHVLNEKNLLALRDANKAYYGPLMVMLAVPATIIDYGRVYMFEGVSSSLQYRNYVVWNWGGILMVGRIFSVLTGFIGLYLFARILLLPEINQKQRVIPVALIVLLLATEYFYFHYTAHFRHWVFLNVILLGQIYLYFLMRQNGFIWWKQWLLQAVLTITTFGISYLGILFNAIWIKDIFTWLRQPRKNREVLVRAIVYGVLVLIGGTLIVLWHPYAFFRILGIVGSDLQNDTGAAVLEENYGTHFSFDYYAGLFFNNHPGLAVAGLLLLVVLWQLRRRINFALYTPVLSILLVYILLFGFQSHHSTHYFLPAIVLLHLLIGMVFVRSVNEKNYLGSRYLFPVVIFFFGMQLTFNGAVLFKLISTLNVPPPDLALGQALIEIQQKEGGKTLLSGCGPLGVPHTRTAYADFASRAERNRTSLYSTILSSEFPFPKVATLLDAYYDDNLPAGKRLNSGDYERVVVCRPFNPEGDPNLRLLHETKLLNYWHLEPFMDRYEFIKPASLNDWQIEGVSFR